MQEKKLRDHAKLTPGSKRSRKMGNPFFVFQIFIYFLSIVFCEEFIFRIERTMLFIHLYDVLLIVSERYRFNTLDALSYQNNTLSTSTVVLETR